MSDLDQLAPLTKTITIAGRDIALRPITMGRLSAFSAAAMPVGSLVLNGRIMEAATEHYSDLSAALIIGAGVEQSWLDDLAPDAFLLLCEAVVEVNADFFIRRLTPLLIDIQSRMRDEVETAMERFSPTSDETDTALRPS